MKKNRTYCAMWFFVCVLLFPAAGFSEDPVMKDSAAPVTRDPVAELSGKKIPIADAIKLILERNPEIVSVGLDGAMSDSAYKKFQSQYDIYLTADGGISYQKFPESVQSQTGESSQGYDLSASIMKMFSTGTTVAAGITEAYQKTTYPDTIISLPVLSNGVPTGDTVPYSQSGTSTEYKPVMFASIQQELLKNAFGYSNRKQEKILSNVSEMQRNGQASRLTGIIAGALVDIWTVSLKRSARDNAVLSLRETKRVRDTTSANVRLGISETYDLNFYNALYAGAESKSAYAEQEYRSAIRTFLRTLHYDAGNNLPQLDGIAELSADPVTIDVDESLKTAFVKRADFNNARLALESAQAEKDMAANDALPSLTVSGSVSSIAQEESLSKANGNAATLDAPLYQVRFKMSYPLGNTAQETSSRDAGFKLRQAQIAYDNLKLEVKDDVQEKAEMIQVAFTSYQKAKVARVESERYYASILANLRMGKIALANVKNALDAMNDSRQRELEALVQYNLSILQFDIATNTLLEKYNIDSAKYISAQ